MNYKNILGLGLIAVSYLATSSACLAAPIRIAKGKVQIVRNEVSYDNATGKSDYKRTPVCTQNIDVSVNDDRNNSGNNVPASVSCTDKVNGKEVKIFTGAMFAIQKAAIIVGEPDTDFKYLAVYSSSDYQQYDPADQLPKIPNSIMYSKDLDQKFFGTISFPSQGVSCSAVSEPVPVAPQPPPRIQSTTSGKQGSCVVENPLGYQVIWEVEDAI